MKYEPPGTDARGPQPQLMDDVYLAMTAAQEAPDYLRQLIKISLHAGSLESDARAKYLTAITQDMELDETLEFTVCVIQAFGAAKFALNDCPSICLKTLSRWAMDENMDRKEDDDSYPSMEGILKKLQDR